jgi:hypothetical protein
MFSQPEHPGQTYYQIYRNKQFEPDDRAEKQNENE